MADRKLKEIERLRGVAVLATVLKHWDFVHASLPGVLRYSWSGVDLFFVISGFVVTTSLLKLLPDLGGTASFVDAFRDSRDALRTFYTRRLFRILPAALAVALLHRILCDAYPVQFGSPVQWFEELVAFLGGIYNYVVPTSNHHELGVYWSLSIEEHFYLFLPLLFVAMRTSNRRLGACVTIILLVALVIRPMGHPEGKVEDVGLYERFSSQFRFDSLMAGTAMALLWPKETKAPTLPPRFVQLGLVPAALILLVCLPGAASVYVMHRVGLIALWMLSGLVVAYAALDRGYVLGLPGIGRVFEYVGTRSYALYLVHFDAHLFEEAIASHFPKYTAFVTSSYRGAWTRFAVLLVATLVVCEILHRLVEKPFIGAGRAVLDRGPSAIPRWTKVLVPTLGVVFLVFPFRHVLVRVFAPTNLAYKRPVAMSSTEPGSPVSDVLVNGLLEDEGGARTQRQDDPWLEIDLGSTKTIRTFVAYNRADGSFASQVPLTITTSTDKTTYRTVDTRDEIFSQGWPWIHRVEEGIQARYVRYSVHGNAGLCLSEVELYER